MFKRHEFWVTLAVFAASIFVLGWLTGQAIAAPPERPCSKLVYHVPRILYPLPLGVTVRMQPIVADYIRCKGWPR